MVPSFDDTILKYFSRLEEPRIERTKQHLLIDIIASAILAVISGADSWVRIETYAQSKREWLETFLALPNDIPSHDTIARVFARLLSNAFINGWSRLLKRLVPKLYLSTGKQCDNRLTAIKDKKTIYKKLLKDSDRSQFTQRILMLLLMNDGKTYQEISEFLDCSRRSVASFFCNTRHNHTLT